MKFLNGLHSWKEIRGEDFIFFYAGMIEGQSLIQSIDFQKCSLKCEGNFSFFWQNIKTQQSLCYVDPIGTYPLFFSSDYVSNSFSLLLETLDRTNEDIEGIIEHRMASLSHPTISSFNYSERTSLREIKRILPGHFLSNGLLKKDKTLSSFLDSQPFNLIEFKEKFHQALLLTRPNRALLLSSGIDSVVILAALRELDQLNNIKIIHAYSNQLPTSEHSAVLEICKHFDLTPDLVLIDDELENISFPEIERKTSVFWRDAYFYYKYCALKKAGIANEVVLTGEFGDQLFGGMYIYPLINYSLIVEDWKFEDIARIFINSSMKYLDFNAKEGLMLPSLRQQYGPIVDVVYQRVIQQISHDLNENDCGDINNKFLMLNALYKGPSRFFPYSQSDLTFYHPFSNWNFFKYSFQLNSREKLSGTKKAILKKEWGHLIPDFIWNLPKTGPLLPRREDFSKR
ncbi:MAG: hypothetical protein Fur0010_15620 [Bdellovibrio sp.]